MVEERYDVLVVGSGPAGAITALVLARGGARVALVDKAGFPRDKACGDLIGPRGVGLLDELGIAVPTEKRLGDLVVLGPTGRKVRLPASPGLTFPGHALAVPRSVFDAALHDAAISAGAEPVRGHAVDPILTDHRSAISGRPTLCGFVLDGDRRVTADVVIGADGATSRVAEVAGLVDMQRVLWGFAVRSYLDATVELPVVALWDETPWHAFAGYGWIFPGPGATSNAGLGIGIGRGGARRRSAIAVRLLPAFLDHLATLGLLDRGGDVAIAAPARLGGWLKMGMVGTVPAVANVLLVGDAAGLVNPLQGEGIAQAMMSGRAAAQAVLDGPSTAAARYRAWLADAHLPYELIAAVTHDVLVGRPRLTSAVGRLLTLPLGPALAGGWAIFWNELFDGAPPGRGRDVAAVVTRLGELGTSAGASARWFRRNVAPTEDPYEATPTAAGRQCGQGR